MFRQVEKTFSRCLVVEASQSCAVIVLDEGEDEVVALLVRSEAVATGIPWACGVCGDRVAQAAVESLDHAVGLRVIGPGELVADAVLLAQPVKGMAAGASGAPGVARSAEPIGELRTIAHWEALIWEPLWP